jgi:hypothetical protein
MEDDQGPHPESLLPYDEWTQEALRYVVVRALAHAAEHGLPGDHHFYLTFRTDHPGTAIPARLKAQYPHEMTIVLQHQFRDLTVGEGLISVGLSFGGVSSTLVIPLAAVTGFADPCVQFMLRFQPVTDTTDPEPEPEVATGESEPPATPPQVVSLDAFRRRTPPKE